MRLPSCQALRLPLPLSLFCSKLGTSVTFSPAFRALTFNSVSISKPSLSTANLLKSILFKGHIAVTEVRIFTFEQEVDQSQKDLIAELAVRFHIRGAAAGEKARTFDDIITVTQGFNKAGYLVGIHGTVSVDHDDEIAGGFLEAAAEGVALAFAVLLDYPDIRPQLPGQLVGAVGRKAVHQEKLIRRWAGFSARRRAGFSPRSWPESPPLF